MLWKSKVLFCTEWSPWKMGNKSLKALEKSLNFFVQKRVWTLYWTCVPISQHRETGVCWGYGSAKAHLECVQLPCWIFETKLRRWDESERCKGDITREDSQQQFSATHYCNVGIMLYLVKSRHCESCLCNITLRPSVRPIINSSMCPWSSLPPCLFFISHPFDCTFNLN